MGRLIEGLWDCEYCDTKAIKGRHRECPNCGKVRDANTKFYLPKSRNYVPESEAKSINRNPDWVCEYCGEQLNSDNDKFCKSCGSPRENEGSNYFEYREKKKAKKKNLYDNGNENVLAEERETAGDNQKIAKTSDYQGFNSYAKNKKGSNGFINWKVIISILLCVVTIAGLVYLFIPKEKEVTILELGWERTIAIEEYKTFDESSWTLPAGARLKYSQSEFHHYDKVLDHYETKTRQVQKERIVGYEEYVAGVKDLGNGYFEEITATRPIYETYYENEEYQEAVYIDVPIYQTKYYYEIDRWIHVRDIKTSEMNKEPYWGEFILKDNERKGRKNEVYLAKTIDRNGKQYTMYFDYLVWNELNTNQIVKVKADVFGNAKLSE